MFATRLAFVDLETTGMRAAVDRITEVGIVTVDLEDGHDAQVARWSSLVDPEVPIPPEIQALTGITDAMVRAAPTFSTLAADIADKLADRVFVAHNARFDHGFLKHAFARTGRPFRARPLCTVKLSRRLEPDAEGHGLDAIIARHALAVAYRHRALGDAEALWLFMQALYRVHPPDTIARVAKGILRIPSLPSHLPPDLVDTLPEAPGVYRFYGANALPLYIGKARNLRERIGAHFSSDWRSETDLRLSAEMTRLEYDVTAGELGALLHEAAAVKAMLPAHNRTLRRKADAGVLHWPEGADVGALAFRVAADLDARVLGGDFGPFASRRAAREHLRSLAAEHELCLTRLKLERRAGPCFARQLGRCRGACVGVEPAAEHDVRLRAALAPLAIPHWPFAGAAAIVEDGGERVDVHVIRDWQWLGTAHDDDGVVALALVSPRDEPFDIDVTRMLLRLYARAPERWLPL